MTLVRVWRRIGADDDPSGGNECGIAAESVNFIAIKTAKNRTEPAISLRPSYRVFCMLLALRRKPRSVNRCGYSAAQRRVPRLWSCGPKLLSLLINTAATGLEPWGRDVLNKTGMAR
jgi:hypothetical protein